MVHSRNISMYLFIPRPLVRMFIWLFLLPFLPLWEVELLRNVLATLNLPEVWMYKICNIRIAYRDERHGRGHSPSRRSPQRDMRNEREREKRYSMKWLCYFFSRPVSLNSICKLKINRV